MRLMGSASSTKLPLTRPMSVGPDEPFDKLRASPWAEKRQGESRINVLFKINLVVAEVVIKQLIK